MQSAFIFVVIHDLLLVNGHKLPLVPDPFAKRKAEPPFLLTLNPAAICQRALTPERRAKKLLHSQAPRLSLVLNLANQLF